MKKNITKIKNIWIWIIIWVWLTLSMWVFAATANWTLWELFKLISWSENGISVSNVYRLEWSNIEDGTITGYEIDDGTITWDDISNTFVANSAISANSADNADLLDNIDSTQFLRSDQDDTMNWVLTVQNWLNRVISTDSWRWIQSYWTDAWGSFYDVDSGSYSILWIAEYALFWKWEINLIWDINLTWDVSTWWEKLATEEYVDNNLWWDTWLTCEYINDEVNNWNITKYCSSWYTLVSCDGYKVTFDHNGTYYESTYNKTLYSDHCRASGSSSWWTAIKMTCCK